MLAHYCWSVVTPKLECVEGVGPGRYILFFMASSLSHLVGNVSIGAGGILRSRDHDGVRVFERKGLRLVRFLLSVVQGRRVGTDAVTLQEFIGKLHEIYTGVSRFTSGFFSLKLSTIDDKFST